MKYILLGMPLAVLSAAALVPAAQAAPFSYRYVELSYTEQTFEGDTRMAGIDKAEIDWDGYGGLLSLDFHKVFLQIGHSRGEVDEVNGINLASLGLARDQDARATTITFGGHGEPRDDLSVYASLSYTREKYDTTTDDIDVDIGRFGGGARYWVIPYVELNASVGMVHTNVSDWDWSENDLDLGVGMRVQPIKWLSVGVSYSTLVDAGTDTVKADVRWQF